MIDDLFPDAPMPKTSESQECVKCNISQPLENYTLLHSGKNRYKICKSCVNRHRQILEQGRRNNPRPDGNYKCPICDRSEEEMVGGDLRSVWHLDHCHKTDKIRSWICSHCNRGLGGFDDDIDRLKKAIDYLKIHKDQEEGQTA